MREVSLEDQVGGRESRKVRERRGNRQDPRGRRSAGAPPKAAERESSGGFLDLPTLGPKEAVELRLSAEGGSRGLAGGALAVSADASEILACVSGNGSRADLVRLARLSREGAFSKELWEGLFLARAALAARRAWEASARALESGLPPGLPSRDPVCEWMSKARPDGFDPSGPVLSAPLFQDPSLRREVDGKRPEPEPGASWKGFAQAESEALAAAHSGPARRRALLGAEDEALVLLDAGAADPVRIGALLRRSGPPRSFERFGGRRVPSALAAACRLPDPVPMLGELSETGTFGPEHWEQAHAWLCDSAARAADGPLPAAAWIAASGFAGDAAALAGRADPHLTAAWFRRRRGDGEALTGEGLARWLAAGAGADALDPDPASPHRRRARKALWTLRVREEAEGRAGPWSLSTRSLRLFAAADPSADGAAFAEALDEAGVSAPEAFERMLRFARGARPAEEASRFLSGAVGAGRSRGPNPALASALAVSAFSAFSSGARLDAREWLDLLCEIPSSERDPSGRFKRARDAASKGLERAFDSQGAWLVPEDLARIPADVRSEQRRILCPRLDPSALARFALDACAQGRGAAALAALARAERTGHWEEMLAEKDADGRSVLFHASTRLSAGDAAGTAVRVLLRAGADPAQEDVDGVSPARAAAALGRVAVMSAFEKASPGILARRPAPDRASPLEVARALGVDPFEALSDPSAPKRFAFARDERGISRLEEWIDQSGFASGWDGDASVDPAGFAAGVLGLGARAAARLPAPKGAEAMDLLRVAVQIGAADEAFDCLEEMAGAAVREGGNSSDPDDSWRFLAVAAKARREAFFRDSSGSDLRRMADAAVEAVSARTAELRRAWDEGRFEDAALLASVNASQRSHLGMPVADAAAFAKVASELLDAARDARSETVAPDARRERLAELGAAGSDLLGKMGAEPPSGAHRRLASLAADARWAEFADELASAKGAERSGLEVFSRLARSKAEDLRARASSGVDAKRRRAAEVSFACSRLSTASYEDFGGLPSGFDPIGSEELGLGSEGVGAFGRKWALAGGIWKSDVCRASVSRSVVDGQEVVFLAVRGTHWACADDQERRGFGRVLEILRDYLQIWRHADRLEPLARAAQRLARERGAKFVMTGHSLGGSAVETLASRLPGFDAAVVFASAGTGLSDGKGGLRRSWLKRRPLDPRVVQFRQAGDLIPWAGRLGGYSGSGRVVDTSLQAAPESKGMARRFSKFVAMVENAAEFFRGQSVPGERPRSGMDRFVELAVRMATDPTAVFGLLRSFNPVGPHGMREVYESRAREARDENAAWLDAKRLVSRVGSF